MTDTQELAETRMDPADRVLWRSATTLPELGAVCARWLLGEVRSQPGYTPGAGPNAETLKLIPTLVDLNRAGFFTTGSQPGLQGNEVGGCYSQRAAVEGFADLAMVARLATVVADTPFEMIVQTTVRTPSIRDPFRNHLCAGVAVSKAEREPCTWFARQHTVASLCGMYSGDLSPAAIHTLARAFQVTLFDARWGINSLWTPLRKAFA
jgi:hypothetical protein